MPNKKRSAKLRDKLLLSGANFKDEHVKSTLKELLRKSKIEDDGVEVDEDVVQEEEDVVNLEDKVEIPVVVKKKTTTAKAANGDKITKKNKKNKYFLLAHPDMKEKVKKDNHRFVVNKDVVEKKFLVDNTQVGKKSAKNGSSRGGFLPTKVVSFADDEIATLWKIEPCSDDDDDDEEEEKKKQKNKKKRKINEFKETKDLKFEIKKEVLADGTLVETYCAVDDKKEDEEEEEKKDEETPKKKKKIQQEPVVELGNDEKKLQASRFRYLNELLYTKKSDESFSYFKIDTDSFKAYHQGFQSQTIKWPLNPLETIINAIKSKPSNLVIADFGCGEAKLAQSLINCKVHSFDFVALNDYVIACDMKNVPLNPKSCDIVVFCLSLMGTNISDFIAEAHRVLKLNGQMKIAEVASRFDNIQLFVKSVEALGFKCVVKEVKAGNYFYFFDFTKTSNDVRKRCLIQLSPCLYKKR